MRRALALAALLVMATPTAASAAERSISFGRFGDLRVYAPDGAAQQVVLFVSGAEGWRQEEAARRLAAAGALVVGIPLPQYLRLLPHAADVCDDPADDFGALARFVEKELGFADYVRPALVGVGEGAALVYAVLAQAPPRTFRGGVGVGFCPELAYDRPLCPGVGLKADAPRDGHIRLQPASLGSPWVALGRGAPERCDPAAAAGFTARTGNARAILPGAADTSPEVAAALGDAVMQFAPLGPGAGPADDVEDLPIVEVPAAAGAAAGDLMAVLVTGDGGWAGIDRDLGRYLSERGIPVVGIDSLRYFWSRKTPARVAADLERVMRRYLPRWDRHRVLLIGYSLGAEGALLMANGLPAELRARIDLLALLAPMPDTDLEVHVSDWVGLGGAGGHDLRPEASRWPRERLLCIYGTEDRGESLCPQLVNATVVPVPGGHHFNYDYEGLAQIILGHVR